MTLLLLCSLSLSLSHLEETCNKGCAALVPVHASHDATSLDVSTTSVIGDPLVEENTTIKNNEIQSLCIFFVLQTLPDLCAKDFYAIVQYMRLSV